MRASLIARLRRLEVSTSGACPACADWIRPVLLREGDPEPEGCPVCDRVPVVILLRRDPDFFANRRRLDEAQAGK